MSGQIALVTGGARGIGVAAATALAREGFAIALNDRDVSTELSDAVEQLQAFGVHAIAVPFDVADLRAHAPMVEQIERDLGPLTTLINNAGVGVLERGDLLDVRDASWDQCFEVNAKAPFFLSQQFTFGPTIVGSSA